MIQSQINITKGSHHFRYGVEYIDDDYFSSEHAFTYNIDNYGDIYFIYMGDDIDVLSNLRRDSNCWYPVSDGITDHMPHDGFNISSLNMYFPRYSVETYDKTLYSLEIYTYIYGHKITLGHYLINRYNALACNKEISIKNNRFYEYVNVPFIDPWYITYSDMWEDFRHDVCGEPENISNTGSLLYVNITPIVNSDRNTSYSSRVSDNSIYVRTPDCVGGMNCMMLSYDKNDYLTNELSIDYNQGFNIISRILFNETYEGDLALYLQEVYGMDTTGMHMMFELVVKDSDNIYSYKGYEYNTMVTSHVFTKDDISLTGWDEFQDGMFLRSSANIIGDDGEVVMTLMSRDIAVTQEEYSKIICKDIDYINIDEIYMNIYNINAVNKIKKEVLSVNRPDDYNTNIIKPIFVRTMPAEHIVVHPGVVENISINLDSYKNYTKMFYIRIEGVDFVETSRTIYGVVFNINGSKLPQEQQSGIYYILDENREMVTTGSYVYEN